MFLTTPCALGTAPHALGTAPHACLPARMPGSDCCCAILTGCRPVCRLLLQGDETEPKQWISGGEAGQRSCPTFSGLGSACADQVATLPSTAAQAPSSPALRGTAAAAICQPQPSLLSHLLLGDRPAVQSTLDPHQQASWLSAQVLIPPRPAGYGSRGRHRSQRELRHEYDRLTRFQSVSRGSPLFLVMVRFCAFSG